MTLHQLQMFAAIAKYRNVTRAARELHITQPAMTHQLKLLQEDFGRLYEKTPRGISLTPDGRFFLEKAEPIISQAEELTKTLGPPQRGESAAPLAIGASNGPAARFLPLVAARFRERHPDVELRLRTETSLKLEAMVQSGEIEIAVVTGRAKLPGLNYERCRRESAVLFAAPGSPLARAEMSMAELGETPVVLFKRGKVGATAQFADQMRRAGIRVRVAMRCDTVEAVKNAVREGVGIGLLYRDGLERDIARGELQLIGVAGLDMRIDSTIVYARRRLSPAAGEFLRLLRDQRRRPRAAARGAPALVAAALWAADFIYASIGQIADAASVAVSWIFC